MDAYAVGIDLAWSERHPTAICVSGPDGVIVSESMAFGDDEVLASIDALDVAATTVAIDAPLLVPNVTGRRPCEASVQAEYGSRHAGPHPSNRSLLSRVHGRVRGEDLAARLVAQGFASPFERSDRTVLECYPHPALIEMFELPERLRYKAKRGFRVADRRAGLNELAGLVATLADAEPPLVAWVPVVDDTVRGRGLKEVEDRLDARVCAWVAATWNRDGLRSIRLFGDPETGHIAVPSRPAHSTG